MIDHDDPNVVEPRVPDSQIESQIDTPVAYGPDKPKRGFVPETAAPRRRRWPWIVLGCLFAPCLCCALSIGVVAGGGAIAASVYDDHRITDSGTETVAIDPGEPVRVEIDSQVGNIEIRSGATDEITVEWTKTASGFSDGSAQDRLNKMSVDASEQDGTVSVVVDAGHTNNNFFSDIFGRANSVDLTITVPDELLALDVGLNIGEISIDNVDVGELALTNNTGDMVFSGALTGDGPFEVRTNIGTVTLELPADTTAQVDATTDIGTVKVEDFDTISGSGSENVPGDEWTGSIGSGQDGSRTLEVRVNIGDVTIRAQ
ncbi:DUF4097 family beta strand repeat-containing protein [Aggregatilinea lenta]|uniref:DUF4097 family beta strand repeat-containing protein n=1 Tax=Aggregatilinea lenta TaxID=913108 RepID=UPI0013C2B289|nr:DUF4097 family beta strand repeat-containing protein [Aggregatilinea lenta]